MIRRCNSCGYFKEIEPRSNPRWCKECFARYINERMTERIVRKKETRVEGLSTSTD